MQCTRNIVLLFTSPLDTSIGRPFICSLINFAYGIKFHSSLNMKEKSSELSCRASQLALTLGSCQGMMEEFLRSNQYIVSVNSKKFNDCTLLLGQYGITAKDVQTYPEVYKCSVSKIRNRLEELHRYGLDASLSLVTISANKYEHRISKLIAESKLEQEYENHEVLLMKLLGCSCYTAELIMTEHSWLRNSRLATLKSNIMLIKSHGVTNEALLQRAYVVVMPQLLLENQLMTLNQNGVLFANNPDSFLSFLQAQNSKFEKCLSRYLAEREILDESGCCSKQEYLLVRLGAQEDDLRTMLRQYPKLMSVNLPKVKRNLDFLLSTCQFYPRDVIINSLVLGFASSTLQTRFQELQKLGIHISPAHLKLSSKNYAKFVNRISGN